MKLIVLTLFTLMCFTSSGQDYDSLREVILGLKKDVSIAYRIIERNKQYQDSYDSVWRQRIERTDEIVNSIHRNMVKSHNEFKVGTVLTIAGIVISGIGVAAKNTAVISTGGGLGLVGWVFHIDSHKYLGRGGRSKSEKDIFKVKSLE